jgi:hypothetical protein
MYLFLCQCHTVSLDISLYDVFKPSIAIAPALFFFSLMIALAIQGILLFHMKVRKIF